MVVVCGARAQCLDSPMTGYEWFKLVLLAPLGVLRFALIFGSIFVCFLAINVLLAHRRHDDMSPLKGPLKWVVQCCIQGTARCICLGCGMIPRIKGWENMKQAEKDRAVIIFNHVSLLDAYVICAFFLPSGVAKASVATIPCIGRISQAMSLIYVERSQKNVNDVHNRFSRRGGNAKRITDRAKDRDYPLVLISPEGTTAHGHGLLTFNKGAFIPGQPVLPMLIRYPYKHLNMGWGMISSTLWFLVRMTTQFYNSCHLELLPVYYPSEEEKRDPVVYMKNVRTYMAEALGVPTFDQGVARGFELTKAGVHVNWDGKTVNNLDAYLEIVARSAAAKKEE